MEESDIADLVSGDLKRVFGGDASVRPSPKKRNKSGGSDGPTAVWVRLPGGSANEVVLRRSTIISPWEMALLEPYGDALAELPSVPTRLQAFVAGDTLMRAIAGQHDVPERPTGVVEGCLRFLLRLAATTYEGSRIGMSLLVDFDRPDADSVFDSIEDFERESWHTLVGTSQHTGVVLTATGGVCGLDDVRPRDPMQLSIEGFYDGDLCPDALRYLGRWSHGNRVGITLTRSGEVWIFSSGEASCVYRNSKWAVLPLQHLTTSAWCEGANFSSDLKKAVVGSLIDASAAHHGACLAIVGRNQIDRVDSLVHASDRWPANVKSKFVRSTSFLELTRRERLELLSIDGATVLSHKGQILATGAIVSVPSGSSGGGRRAATEALAALGCAFKVSQDGEVILFGMEKVGKPRLRVQFG